MKKVSLFVLTLILCLSGFVISGCSSDNKTTTPEYSDCSLLVEVDSKSNGYISNHGTLDISYTQSSGTMRFRGKLVYSYNGVNYADEIEEDLGVVECGIPDSYVFNLKFSAMPHCSHISFDGTLKVTIIPTDYCCTNTAIK